ncbi:dsDNA nuclease domain-containing protein [Pseudomonas sp. 2FG]|uniref:dsDNA nuclease domain-containing protein n=1 Tax=Pseudomonas sp. 2FG TaxID=2502191 RepID=UPI0014858DE2|nr:dsDNA nuclease domain-containing protein [Pseudomonas sp. 2FG]
MPGLGVPGQAQGRATLQSDRGDETQALFMYQWAAGVVLLAGALASLNEYVAIWCEHHDDLLAELPTGGFHAIQVKTVSAQGASWTCSDSGFVDAVRKFAEHEAKYSSQLQQYIFFSNAKPYIPGATAKAATKLASSPFRVRDECRIAADEGCIPAPYKASFDALVKASGTAPATVFKVLRKLEFQVGPPLEGFREHLSSVIGGVPVCKQFTLEWLEKLRDELLLLVGKASSLDVPSLDFYASILQQDGRPEAAVRGKRISVEDFEIALKQHPSGGFRYAEVGGHLRLGKASGQMEVLRQKMNAGFVGAYFDSVWLQAMAAERRLMERAHEDPDAALRITNQLEGVMLVECQNAEAEAALEVDERRRGLLIYQRILQRTDELTRHDRASVENERAETLRGVAGLLSGSCKFAWGVPPDTGGGDGA